MPEALSPWRQTSAWAGVTKAGPGGAAGEPGVRIELVEVASILAIAARVDQRDALARLLDDRLGCALPAPGRLTTGRRGDMVWSAPDQWLAVSASGFEADLVRAIAEVAAVTDQSSSRAVLTVSGRDARDALAKGFAIDLHPDVFTLGSTAVTNVAHISVQIWQRDEGRYTIAVPRSFVAGFWSWLVSASAVYGYEVAA